IVLGYASAVYDPYAVRNVAQYFTCYFTNCGMDELGLVRGGVMARPDGPDGLVRYHEPRRVPDFEPRKGALDLPVDDGHGLPAFLLFERLADAHDNHSPLGQRGVFLLPHHRVRLVEYVPPLRV